MNRVIPIAGTFEWQDIPLRTMPGRLLWWQQGSEFSTMLAAQGIENAFPDRPFVWSTLLPQKDKRAWQDAGEKLYFRADALPFDDRNFIAYSYGGEVLLYAMGFGLQVRNVIGVGVPVRQDMTHVDDVITKNHRFARWHAIIDPLDPLLFIGSRWFHQTHSFVTSRDRIFGISHGRVLEVPRYYHYWHERGWFDILKASVDESGV